MSEHATGASADVVKKVVTPMVTSLNEWMKKEAHKDVRRVVATALVSALQRTGASTVPADVRIRSQRICRRRRGGGWESSCAGLCCSWCVHVTALVAVVSSLFSS